VVSRARQERIIVKPRAFVLLPAFIAALAALSACTSFNAPAVHAYPGAQKAPAALSNVQLVGNGFPGIYLYRVDGHPRTTAAPKIVAATFSDSASLGFSIFVPEGRHVLEFYNVHKTPFDKAPLDYRTISFSTEAGKTYVMSRAGDSWQVKCEGKTVESVVGKVPVMESPGPGEPKATLVFDRTDSLIVAYVFRIDDKLSPTMTYIEPRWVAFNSPGTMPMTIRNTAVPNIIHSPLIDPGYGKLSVAIAPGHHIIEYGTDYLPMAYRCMGDLVRYLEFDAEADKTYLIKVDKAADITPTYDGSNVTIVGN